jgi:hypothetical protein
MGLPNVNQDQAKGIQERLHTAADRIGEGAGGEEMNTVAEAISLFLHSAELRDEFGAMVQFSTSQAMGYGAMVAWVAQHEEVERLRRENDELMRLLANATDPENYGDLAEAREVGWAHVLARRPEEGDEDASTG